MYVMISPASLLAASSSFAAAGSGTGRAPGKGRHTATPEHTASPNQHLDNKDNLNAQHKRYTNVNTQPSCITFMQDATERMNLQHRCYKETKPRIEPKMLLHDFVKECINGMSAKHRIRSGSGDVHSIEKKDNQRMKQEIRYTILKLFTLIKRW